MQDIENHTRWYFQSGWREAWEHWNTYSQEHGGNPKWKPWLAKYAEFLDDLKHDAELSEQQTSAPKKIRYWPAPHQLLKDPVLDEERREFLGRLYALSYCTMSRDAHLTFPGLLRRSSSLMQSDADPEELKRYKSLVFSMTVVLTLALVSEVVGVLDLRARTEDCRFLWVLLGDVTDDATELYNRRYRGLLTGS